MCLQSSISFNIEDGSSTYRSVLDCVGNAAAQDGNQRYRGTVEAALPSSFGLKSSDRYSHVVVSDAPARVRELKWTPLPSRLAHRGENIFREGAHSRQVSPCFEGTVLGV